MCTQHTYTTHTHTHRNRGDYKTHHDELEALGVVIEVEESESEQGRNKPIKYIKSLEFETVCAALQTYKKIHGDLLVPASFSVPSKAKDQEQIWSEDTHGLRLGWKVQSIRHSNDSNESNDSNGEKEKKEKKEPRHSRRLSLRQKKKLTELGFDFSRQRVTYGGDAVLKALRVYVNM